MGPNLEDEFSPSLEVDSIETFNHSTKSHLSNTEYHWRFHFETIHEWNFLGASEPNRIKSKWINTVQLRSRSRILNINLSKDKFFRLSFVIFIWLNTLWGVATLSEDLCWHWSVIVVNQAAVCCEEAHKKEEVSNRSKLSSQGSWFGWRKAEPNTEDEKEGAMHDITEHDTEEEWERDACKQCWVCLFVSWNTISIYDQLERTCELVNLEICWLRQSNVICTSLKVQIWWFQIPIIIFLVNQLIELDICWHPHESMEHLTIDWLMQIIHMNQNLFLSHNKQLKNLQLWNITFICWFVKINQQWSNWSCGLFDVIFNMHDVCFHNHHFFVDCVQINVLLHVFSHSCTNFLDFLFNMSFTSAVDNNDENVSLFIEVVAEQDMLWLQHHWCNVKAAFTSGLSDNLSFEQSNMLIFDNTTNVNQLFSQNNIIFITQQWVL